MKLEDVIKKQFNTISYIDAMEKSIVTEDDQIQSEIRYDAWAKTHERELMEIYVKRVKELDEDAIGMSWILWSRFVFFVSEYNARMEATIKEEMRIMLGNG